MQHLPPLITDLALILIAAAVVSFVFKKLKQPVVLGYIIAGFFVGPNFNVFPTVAEADSIKIWAEIGVLFLLFGLGLEFSFKKMLKVGGVAVISALMGVGLTMLSGFTIAGLLGWNTIDSLFFGGILAIASTTIIIKAYEELGVKTQKFAGIVTGILVIEDIFAVVLMVVLSTVAISRSFEGIDMAISLIKLVFFLVLWFVSGIYFLPSLLKSLKKLLSEETLLILSLALCFLMVVLAANAGFSPALGAFIMGSILAETTKAEKIEHSIKPLQSLFGAIFFVSVGMLIDPEMLVLYAFPIFISTLVLLVGKPLFVIGGALISGEPLKVAIQSGMSLSQIGEFSFIIATLGLSLNVTSDFLYPIAVAVSVLTTFTTPFMIRLSEPVYQMAEKRMPLKWKEKLNRYSIGAQKVSEESDWKNLLKFLFTNTVIFAVIVVSIILISTKYIYPHIPHNEWTELLVTLLTLILLSPFLWALSFRTGNPKAFANIWKKRNQRGPLMALMIGRLGLSLFFIGFLFDSMYSTFTAFIGLGVSVFLLFLVRKKIKLFYARIEGRFIRNFNQRELESNERKIPEITPWDSHMATIELSSNFPFIGKTLYESRLREDFGINIALIKRDDVCISVPNRNERIYPKDVLSIIGTDEQLKQFREYIDVFEKESLSQSTTSAEVSLHHFSLHNSCELIGQSIRSSSIRELTHGLVVGIEREGSRYLNPESDWVFKENDTVWLVGNEKRIQVLLKNLIHSKA